MSRKQSKGASFYTNPAAGVCVGVAAKRLGVNPRAISNALAAVDPEGEIIPIVGHRRRLSPDMVEDVRQLLINRGVLEPPKKIV